MYSLLSPRLLGFRSSPFLFFVLWKSPIFIYGANVATGKMFRSKVRTNVEPNGGRKLKRASADQIRAGDQSIPARPRNSADLARARRRGDRIARCDLSRSAIRCLRFAKRCASFAPANQVRQANWISARQYQTVAAAVSRRSPDRADPPFKHRPAQLQRNQHPCRALRIDRMRTYSSRSALKDLVGSV
jgi:hypothetical protein